MAKITKVSPHAVYVSFHCEGEGCDESAKVSVSELIGCGVPYCTECDRDMFSTYDYVEVEA